MKLHHAVASSLLAMVICTAAFGATPLQQFAAGFDLLKAGKLAQAASKFEQGLKADAGNANAHFYLAEACYGLKRTAQAQAHYQKALDLDPSGPQAEQARKRLDELAGGPGSAASRSESSAEAGKVFKDCDVCPDMVVIPAGQFIMGSPPSEPGRRLSERPPHLVNIARPFAVGKFEVTFEQWDACVAARECGSVDDEGWGRQNLPVINVSWEQAQGYVEWLAEKTGKKYRLLSEAEWEYAARAGSDKARFWGSSPERACQFANVYDQTGKLDYEFPWPNFDCDDRYAQTAPVGSFKPNAFGLHDMLGNVEEWVADCYNKTYVGAPADGSVWALGDCAGRVRRGGSWNTEAELLRSAYRTLGVPARRIMTLGFRVARTLP
jgi:formylglycine-generating enzyme required for sulfatase activity